MTPEDLLYALVDVFDRLGVPYFITGSVAAMTYGEPRFTNDVDVVADLTEKHVDAFCDAFPAPDYYVSRDAMLSAIRSQRQFNVLHITGGVKADIILPRDPEFDRSRFARRRTEHIGTRGDASLASPEDVILKKLDYYREGQSEKHLRDITGILRICPYPVDREYIEAWARKRGSLETWQLILQNLADRTADNEPA